MSVAPHAGVWIEICKLLCDFYECSKSLPTRECGLKFVIVGAMSDISLSLPMRECGLKLKGLEKRRTEEKVAPHAGVWIEIWMVS